MNVDFSRSRIGNFQVNFVGNKFNQEPLILSTGSSAASEDTLSAMKILFLDNINTSEIYRFYHDNGIKYNVVYDIVRDMFNGAISIHEASHSLAHYLYDQCTHPNIKSGEFYVIFIKDCLLDGETIEAIGLFKTENRDVYLDVDRVDRTFSVISRDGINVNRWTLRM